MRLTTSAAVDNLHLGSFLRKKTTFLLSEQLSSYNGQIFSFRPTFPNIFKNWYGNRARKGMAPTRSIEMLTIFQHSSWISIRLEMIIVTNKSTIHYNLKSVTLKTVKSTKFLIKEEPWFLVPHRPKTPFALFLLYAPWCS